MLQVNFIGFNSVSWIPGVYILYFTPLPPRGKKWQSADAQQKRKKENNKLNEEKEGKNKFCKIILAIYFMTYITADERGGDNKKYTRLQLVKRRTGKKYDVNCPNEGGKNITLYRKWIIKIENIRKKGKTNGVHNF